MNKPKQTCTVCSHQSKCWAVATNSGKSVSTQNILINLLICRLQLGINRDQAAANLLQIFRPGMIKLISHVKQSGGALHLDMDQLLLDMQSTAIEYLMRDYKIGDRGRATPYLFDPHQGFLTKWIKWITSKSRRFYTYHELYNPMPSDDTESETSDNRYDTQYTTQGSGSSSGSWSSIIEGGTANYSPATQDTNESSDLSQLVTDIIEDGRTLNSNEYRVIKFCMHNGNESNATRHIDGLHIYLAQLMGVSRPRITRLYKRSKEKLLKRYQQIQEESADH